MATLTIYSDASDDTLLSAVSGSYATASASASALLGSNNLRIGQLSNASAYQLCETFVSFDTSGIGAGTVTSATLSLYVTSDASDADFTANVRLRDWGSAVETSDWVVRATLTGLTLLASASTVGLSTNAYKDFTSEAAFVSNISATSTRMIIASDRFEAGTDPGLNKNEYIEVGAVELSGTTQDPKLVIVFTPPVSGDLTLNPAFDVTVGGWTTDSGGTTNLYAAIDEGTASDSDYVKSPAGPASSQYYETGLETLADPASSSGHVVHYRYEKNISGGAVDLTVSLRQGASTEIASWAHTGISNSWTQQDQTLTGGQADSITDYNDLRIRFTPTTTTSDQVPTYVADRASANSNSAVTTVDLVLTGLTVGNYLIIRSAADNSGGGGAARTLTMSNQSGTAMGTHTEYQQNNDPGSASAGVTCNVSVIKIAATSGTIRLTYSGSVVQACVAEEWSGIDGTTPVVGTPVGANGTASTNLVAGTALTDASIAAGNVAYATAAVEGPTSDTYTQDADTTNGSWTTVTKLGTSDATADLNMTTYGGYKAVTAAGGQTYNPTINNARDSAGLILELKAAAATIRTQVSWANFELPSSVTDATVTPSVVAGTGSVPAPVVMPIRPSVVAATASVAATTIQTGSTVTPSVVASVASVSAPTVKTGSTVTPAVVAVTASVPAPTVAISHTANPAVVASTATVSAPTLHTGSTVAASVVAAVASIPAPTVAISHTASPAVVAATASLSAVAVQTGSTVTTSVVAATASLPSAAEQTGSTTQSATVAAAATVPAPTVAISHTANPAVVASTATVAAPTVQTGSTVAPLTVTATATLPAPALQTGSAVAPFVVAAVTTVPTPSVTTDSTANVSATTVVATATLSAASVSAGSTVSPSAVAAMASVPSATVSGGATATPTTVTATATVPSAAETAGSTSQSATVAATATVPSVSISTGSEVGASTVTATGTVLAAMTQAGATALPAAVTAATTLPAAAVTTGSTVGAVTVVGVATVPATTEQAGASTQLAAVVGVAIIPAPTVTTGSTVQVDVIAAVATLPAPTTSAHAEVTVSVVTATVTLPAAIVALGADINVAVVNAIASVPTATVVADRIIETFTVTAIATVPIPMLALVSRLLGLEMGDRGVSGVEHGGHATGRVEAGDGRPSGLIEIS